MKALVHANASIAWADLPVGQRRQDLGEALHSAFRKGLGLRLANVPRQRRAIFRSSSAVVVGKPKNSR